MFPFVPLSVPFCSPYSSFVFNGVPLFPFQSRFSRVRARICEFKTQGEQGEQGDTTDSERVILFPFHFIRGHKGNK